MDILLDPTDIYAWYLRTFAYILGSSAVILTILGVISYLASQCFYIQGATKHLQTILNECDELISTKSHDTAAQPEIIYEKIKSAVLLHIKITEWVWTFRWYKTISERIIWCYFTEFSTSFQASVAARFSLYFVSVLTLVGFTLVGFTLVTSFTFTLVTVAIYIAGSMYTTEQVAFTNCKKKIQVFTV